MTHITIKRSKRVLPAWINSIVSKISSIELPSWLQSPSPHARKMRRRYVARAIDEYGLFKATYSLLIYDGVNTLRKLRRSLYLAGPPPAQHTVFHRRERVGIMLLLSFITLSAMTGTRHAVDTESVRIPTTTYASTTAAGDTIPALQPSFTPVRPVVATYADPEYPYPHQRIELGEAMPVRATFTGFHGKFVGAGMYSRFLGVEGAIPKTAITDPIEVHRRQFALKFANNPDATPVAHGMEAQYEQMYNVQRTYMSLAQFVETVRMVDHESFLTIDFDELCAERALQLGPQQCALLKSLAGQTTPEEQVGYALTELLGRDATKTGIFNSWVFDQGLRNYGREFWDLTPAGGDPLASGGAWQFTSHAVGAYVDEDGKPQIGFVTLVSRHATLKVPESFLDFKRTDHERAAFYFRVANIAFLIRDAAKDKHAYATLVRLAQGGHGSDWLAFVATSHHAQNKVRRDYAMPWLRAGATKPFASYLRGSFKAYGESTRINYAGLIRYLSNPQVAIASISNKGKA